MTDEPSNTDENVDPDEIRLMAYLLEELEGEEKDQIEKRLANDTEFAKKRNELEQAAAFMKEASAIDLSFEDESVEPFQLSQERRDSIFKEEPKKRSRLLTFNSNHPLIPVAVAASFFFILFSDRILFFRDQTIDRLNPEVQQREKNIQNVQLEVEGEKDEAIFANFGFGDFEKRDQLKEQILQNESRANSNMLENEEGQIVDSFGYGSRLDVPGEEMSTTRVDASKRRLSNARYFEDTVEIPREEKNRFANSEPNSPVRQNAPLANAPQSILLQDKDNVLAENESVFISGEEEEDFKFSLDAITPSESESPAIQLKKQDATTIASSLPKLSFDPRRQITEVESGSGDGDDEVFELSPFSVDSSSRGGYRSTNTLSGSRLRRNSVGDVGYKAESVDTLPFLHENSVYTQESLDDTSGIRSGSNSAISKEVVSFLEPGLSVPAPAPSTDGSQVGVIVGRIGGVASNESASVDLGDGSETTIGWDYNVAKNPEFGNIDLVGDLLASSDLPDSLSEIQAPHLERVPGDKKEVEADKAIAPVRSNPALVEYPEYLTAVAPQSTFSLNVSDVSFRLTQSHLNNRQLPVAGTLRTEEFINAFDYGDPEPTLEESIGFSWGRAHWPYTHDKDVVRLSLKTAAAGRLDSQPMNLVLAIDSSGSMSRVDRLQIVDSILQTIGQELRDSDTVSVIGFSQDARLILDSVSSDSSARLSEVSSQLNPRGGTDLEAGLRLAYETAVRTFRSGAVNRIVLFTDGAANLGNTVAEDLTALVEENRQAGIALDSFGIGFDGHNDVMLERLSRNGDGRYRFLRNVDEVQTEFGENLLGSLRPAANDVKIQVEFNPDRVRSYQLLGYQQHQLKSEDFRDNAVDAAEIGAAEAGNALYLIDIVDSGSGDLGVVRARFRDAASGNYEERSWSLPYSRNVPDLEEAAPSMRLATVAAGFAALLNESPLAADIEFQSMINLSQDLQDYYPLNPDVIALPNLLLRAQQLSGRQ